MEACGDSPKTGYTTDYVPTLTTFLDDQYDADLIAGDDTNFIDNKTASVDCSLYMGEFEFANTTDGRDSPPLDNVGIHNSLRRH